MGEGGLGYNDEPVEQVVELVLVADVGPGLFADLPDGVGIEAAGFAEEIVRDHAAHVDSAGAALLDGCVVEEGVRIGVEQAVREDRWHRGVDGDALDFAGLDLREDVDEAGEIHGFAEDILHDLADERVAGDLDVAFDVFEASCRLREDAGEEIFAASALDLRWDLLALLKSQQLQTAGGVPAEAGFEDGRGERCLLKQLGNGVGGEELENVGEGERMLFRERDVEAIVGGGGLQFEVEAAAETLAQGESPGLVDAAAEGRVQDELHAAALVEEALGDDGGEGGNGPEDGAAGDDIGDELLSAGVVYAAFFFEPSNRCSDRWIVLADVAGEQTRRAGGDVFAQLANPA